MAFLNDLETTLAAGGLTRALELTIRELHAESGTIHRMEADGVLHLKASSGIPESVLDIVRLVPVGKGMAGLAVERKEPVSICNLQASTGGDARPGAKKTGMEGAIVVPMMAGDQAVGALGIANRTERTFTPEEIALLMDIGRRLA
ncbi:MAG TPA: GAF domain-containing protein [Bryobacteraceae bacterium]|nr:GAF domain-containing protein [Bryobacteraceae bacterium]